MTILLPGLALGGCQPARPSPAQAADQQQRAQSLATQMAGEWQAAQKEERRQAAATAQAIQDMVAELSVQPADILEAFDDNAAGWPEGEVDDPLALLNRTVADGAYRWEATAKEGFVWWADPEMDPVQDFYASVEVEQVDGAMDGEAGLVFRLTDDENFYLFETSRNQTYSLYLSYQDEWQPLIDWTDDQGIRPHGPNRLAVLARGDHFTLFINDTPVADVVDSTLAEGKIAMVVGLSSAGNRATWQFDNLRLSALPAGFQP